MGGGGISTQVFDAENRMISVTANSQTTKNQMFQRASTADSTRAMEPAAE
jgi:hypothetical protein